MKKTLLLLLTFVGVNAFAQNTCATAVNITTNGDYVTGTVSGTFPTGQTGLCWATSGSTPNALWYTFTPPTNGIVTISSAIAANPGGTTGIDTRLHFLTGSCGGPWTCVDSNDDITPGSDYRSALVDVPVTSGTTYYILWDNRWDDTAFTFNLTFTGASCFAPPLFYLPDYLSTTSADLYWDQSTPVPATYDVDWSNNFATPAGSGTIVSASAGALAYSTANISGATASSNFRYYVRANCNPELSAWAGPYYGYLPVTLPYSNDFEDASKNYTDGFVNFSLITTNGTSTPPNYADGGAGTAMYTFNSTTAASNARAYFRGMNLTAGEQVTVEFKTRLFAFAPDVPEPISFNLTVGDSQSTAGQATVVQTYTNTSAAAYTTHTATFTAPTSGIYYFGIHNNTPQATVETFLFLDSINLTTNLSSADNSLTGFSVYPNPVTTSLVISNPNNFEVKNISITDVNGRMVKNQQGALTQINVSDLNAGVYFVTIEASEGKTTKKFIKQ
ncbi:T9SS type A sorting domain-containing protein [Flavobacterium sp.]|uniref:T9SS type A sorting domain-containing protein n=1 Tax=Flavobacterium sp. TaxID=239 RepID=UPI004048C87F